MCMMYSCDPQIIFCQFFRSLNLVIFLHKARFFLLVDLRDFFFSDLGSGGRKK